MRAKHTSATPRFPQDERPRTFTVVQSTVTVSAETAQVQTDSSEHSAILTTSQLENLTARGRDVVSMLRTIPGVQYQADQDSVGGQYGTSTPNIGGATVSARPRSACRDSRQRASVRCG